MLTKTTNVLNKTCKKIINVVNTMPVISINDIAEAAKLSKSEVKTKLSKYSLIAEEIKAQLEENKSKLKVSKKKRMKNKQDTGYEERFVIDASITGTENLFNTLSEICETNAKLILTSVTINELDKMQKFNDTDGYDARHILAMAAENPDSFQPVLIDETLEEPDECIIRYCVDNKDKVVLLTADKKMALRARMYGVKTRYIKINNNYKHSNFMSKTYISDRTNTLWCTRKFAGKLFITDFNNECRSILVISDGIKYTDGIYDLKIGDDVYLATKKPEYLTFAHYHIISLEEENNCQLIYSKRIYDISAIDTLPKAEYKSFMRDFKHRIDL